jgi:hypothetical protein
MATGTASGTTNFVLGKDLHGNREVRTFKHGEEYSIDYPDAVVAYTVITTRFPYSVAN